MLIDTAGIRRRARVSEMVEKFSTVQSLQAIEDAGAVIALLDARAGVTDQDLHLIGLAVERGRALVIALNKWDRAAEPTSAAQAEEQVERRLDFASFANVHYISALHGSGIAELLNSALIALPRRGRRPADAAAQQDSAGCARCRTPRRCRTAARSVCATRIRADAIRRSW